MTILRSLLTVGGVITDVTALSASGALTDTFAGIALDGGGNAVRTTQAQMLTWIQGHYGDLPGLAAPVALNGTTVLDASAHSRRLLVATTALTLNAPSTFGNIGSGFRCTVVADGGAVTFGTGIAALYSTLAVGQSAEIVAYTNASGNVVRALVGAAVSTTPAISAAGPAATPHVASGGTTVAVPLTVSMSNMPASPAMQIAIDGGAYAALPSGSTVTQTAVTGLSLTLAGGAHTVLLRETASGAVSNSVALTVESETLAGIPTSGWTVNAAHTLAGATTTMAGLTTAYAALWNGTAEVGARQSFTSSATLAALSFTPVTANAVSTIRTFDAATGGNLLAESPAFTVAAAAAGTAVAPVFAPTGSVNTGPFTINSAQNTYHHNAPSSFANGSNIGGPSIFINRTNGTAPEDGSTPNITGSVTFGWTTSLTSLTPTAGNAGSTGNVNHGGPDSGQTAGQGVNALKYFWDWYAPNGPTPAGQWYQLYNIPCSDGNTYYAFCGPFTAT